MSPHDSLAGRDRPTVIRSKITVPALSERFSPRPRAEQLVIDLLGTKRAVVVSAAAGAGKTTVAVEALVQLGRPIAWLTVDRPDRAPGRLLTYLEAALAPVSPSVVGSVGPALAAGLAHPEAAGLLAQAVDETPVVLVLDDLERLGSAPAAWGIIEAMLRYLPAASSALLISRRDIPTTLCALPSPERVAVVADPDLAFTPEEAADALARVGRPDIDPAAAVARTSGWVAGVLFESWRRDVRPAASGAETDPLFAFLASQILGELDAQELELLVSTALFDEVSVARAEALGIARSAETLERLRSAHLPVTWNAERGVLRCHDFFREYLLQLLERRSAEAVRGLRIAVARTSVVEGHDEEAVEGLLRAGAFEAALEPASRCILAVIERADFAVAERWLVQLQPFVVPGAGRLTIAQLMLSIGQDQVGRGIAIADALSAEDRHALSASSDRARWLLVWCYLHVARYDEVEALLEGVPAGAAHDAVRWAMRVLKDGHGSASLHRPALTGGILDALVLIADYALGRLTSLAESAEESPWAAAVQAPYRIAALRALGRTSEALELYEAISVAGTATPAVSVFALPELLLDLGRGDEAGRLVLANARVVAESGSLALAGINALNQAKHALRVLRDPERALATLDAPAFQRAATGVRLVFEIGESWRGLALLLLNRDREALEVLEATVSSMVAGDRILELPTAAVHLSEAAWRAGDPEASDRAADLALSAAGRQGSNHLLLQALAEFPAVLSRRLDGEAEADTPWHELGRALIARGGSPPALGGCIRLVEFGTRTLHVDGDEVHLRIAKSYELLAYLLTRSGRSAKRDDVLHALFDGRRDNSTRAYTRQAIHGLRQVLPEGVLHADQRTVALVREASATSESLELETRLAAAAGQQGDARITATLAALEAYERGGYLPGVRAGWADERERHLAALVTDARHQTAVVAYGAGRYHEAQHLLDAVLAIDAFREAAYRLAMRIAHALGDEDGVIRAYGACERALAVLDALPSRATRELLDGLRR